MRHRKLRGRKTQEAPGNQRTGERRAYAGRMKAGALKSPFGGALDSLSGKTVKKRKLVIRQINRVEEMGNCHVLFVSTSEKMHLPNILAAVKNQNVLTVSDMDRFAEAGGIINFITLEDKVRFEINVDAAAQTPLKLSSQLLRVAKLVGGGAPEEAR